MSSEAARLKNFWNSRYREFSLRESGIKTHTPAYSELLYRCKRKAYQRAVRATGLAQNASPQIVDGGCGQGFFAAVVLELFHEPRYLGIDISEKAVEFLAPRFPQFEWRCGDLAHPTIVPAAVFDLAQSIEVLHLILDDSNHRLAITHLAAGLKPGGILLLTDTLPSARSSPNEYIAFRPRPYYEELFAKLKLECLEIFPMYYCLPDMGLGSGKFRRACRLLPPGIVYAIDRMALRLRLPQLGQSHDSQMKMMVCRKLTSDPRSHLCGLHFL